MKPQPVEAAIFDVDGTLIDSVDFHAIAWVEAFAEFGVATAFEKVRRQIGKGGDNLMPVFLSQKQIRAFGQDLETFRGGRGPALTEFVRRAARRKLEDLSGTRPIVEVETIELDER